MIVLIQMRSSVIREVAGIVARAFPHLRIPPPDRHG